jgi:hypothetical protein
VDHLFGRHPDLVTIPYRPFLDLGRDEVDVKLASDVLRRQKQRVLNRG